MRQKIEICMNPNRVRGIYDSGLREIDSCEGEEILELMEAPGHKRAMAVLRGGLFFSNPATGIDNIAKHGYGGGDDILDNHFSDDRRRAFCGRDGGKSANSRWCFWGLWFIFLGFFFQALIGGKK